MVILYIKFVPQNGVPQVPRKKGNASQVMVKEPSIEEDYVENVPPNLGETVDLLDDWPELQRLIDDGESVETLFEKGWRPLLKSKSNGKQYMTLRLHGKDPDSGEHVDTERGLGILSPENHSRWDTFLALYEESKPPLPSVDRGTSPPQNPPQQSTGNRSSVLTTKVGRIAPIGPSVQIKLGTLQWFTWVQQACGYPGALDDFINETVDAYFREHHHLELAVVIQGE